MKENFDEVEEIMDEEEYIPRRLSLTELKHACSIAMYSLFRNWIDDQLTSYGNGVLDRQYFLDLEYLTCTGFPGIHISLSTYKQRGEDIDRVGPVLNPKVVNPNVRYNQHTDEETLRHRQKAFSMITAVSSKCQLEIAIKRSLEEHGVPEKQSNVHVEMYYGEGLNDWKVRWLKRADSDSFGYIRHCIFVVRIGV